MKNLILSLFFLGVSLASHAQELTLYEGYQEYLDQIDASKVSTGFLLNRGFLLPSEMEMLNEFSAASFEDTGDIIPALSNLDGESWVHNYTLIQESNMSETPLPTNDQLSSLIDSKGGDTIPFMMFDILGELADSTAIANAVGSSTLVSEEINLFGAISSVAQSISNDVAFELDINNLFVSNKTEQPAEIYIDFDDGNEPQVYPFANRTFNVSYNSTGDKIITIYIRYDSGEDKVYGSSFVFNVIGSPTNVTASSVIDTEIDDGSSSSSRTITTPGAKSYIFEGVDQAFDRPVIVVQGFDITGNSIDLQSQQRKYMNQRRVNFFKDHLEPRGLDLVLVILDDTQQSIQQNTAVVKQVLKQLNSLKERGKYESVLIGESMGGLLCRAALKELENEGYDHEVGTYVSFDAPHKGANIPVGFQTALRDAMSIHAVQATKHLVLPVLQGLTYLFKGLTFGNLDGHEPVINARNALQTGQDMLNALRSNAARSMIINHMDQGTLFNDTQNYLNNLGYPEHTRNVAMINGSNESTDRQLDDNNNQYNPGDRLGYKKFPALEDKNFAELVINSGMVNRTNFNVSNVKISLSTFAPVLVPVVTTRNVCQSIFRRICIPFTDICVDNLDRVICSPLRVTEWVLRQAPSINTTNKTGKFSFGPEPYDIAPGATTYSGKEADEVLLAHWTYIPTVSSIDLDQSVRDGLPSGGVYAVTNDIVLDDFIKNDQTPFDEIYSLDENTNHVYYWHSMLEGLFVDIIDEEMMPHELYIQDKTMSNDRKFYATDFMIMGNDVDPHTKKASEIKIKDKGDVVVQNGKNVEFRSVKSISIKPGTHFKPGSSVRVYLDEITVPTSTPVSSGARQAGTSGIKTDAIRIVGRSKLCSGELLSLEVIEDHSNEYSYGWFVNNVYQGSGRFLESDQTLGYGLNKVRLIIKSEDGAEAEISKVVKVRHTGSNCPTPQVQAAKNFELELEKNSLTIYPNPTTGIVNVALPQAGDYTINLLNAQGRTIATQTVSDQNQTSFNLSGFAKGVYLVQVNGEEESFVKRVVLID